MIYGRGELSNLKLQNTHVTEEAMIINDTTIVYEEDDSYFPAQWFVRQKDDKFFIFRKQKPSGTLK